MQQRPAWETCRTEGHSTRRSAPRREDGFDAILLTADRETRLRALRSRDRPERRRPAEPSALARANPPTFDRSPGCEAVAPPPPPGVGAAATQSVPAIFSFFFLFCSFFISFFFFFSLFFFFLFLFFFFSVFFFFFFFFWPPPRAASWRRLRGRSSVLQLFTVVDRRVAARRRARSGETRRGEEEG